MNRLFNKRIILYGIISVLILGVVTVILTPDIFLFKRGSRFAIHFMLTYLAMGLFFFIINSRMLMYASLLGSLSLAIYLQSSTNEAMRYAKTTQAQKLKIVLFNVSELSSPFEKSISMLKEMEADLLFFQEVTPDWISRLDTALHEVFQHKISLVRIDPFGQAIFSKHPLTFKDTVLFNGIPSLKADLILKENRVSIMSSHALPALDSRSYLMLKEQLYTLAEYIQHSETATILVGDFNIEPWAGEIQDFKYNATMRDSRRTLFPTKFNGAIPKLNLPQENIFYTNEIECTKFDPMYDSKNRQLGVMGIYQFKIPLINESRKGSANYRNG